MPNKPTSVDSEIECQTCWNNLTRPIGLNQESRAKSQNLSMSIFLALDSPQHARTARRCDKVRLKTSFRHLDSGDMSGGRVLDLDRCQYRFELTDWHFPLEF